MSNASGEHEFGERPLLPDEITKDKIVAGVTAGLTGLMASVLFHNVMVTGEAFYSSSSLSLSVLTVWVGGVTLIAYRRYSDLKPLQPGPDDY
jgi:hypothetical protein